MQKFSYTEISWSWIYNVFGEVFLTGLPFKWATAEQISSTLSFSTLGVRPLWISEIGRTGSFSLAKIFEVCFLSFTLDRYIYQNINCLTLNPWIHYIWMQYVDVNAYVDVNVDVCHKNAIYVKEIQTPPAVWPARLSPLSHLPLQYVLDPLPLRPLDRAYTYCTYWPDTDTYKMVFHNDSHSENIILLLVYASFKSLTQTLIDNVSKRKMWHGGSIVPYFL